MIKKLRRTAAGAAVTHRKTTAHLATETMPLPQKVVLVMQQHIGAPCVPIVKKGDTVKLGTVVGKAQGFVGADIHSGVSGTVTGIEQLVTPTGSLVDAVIIAPDGEQAVDDNIQPPLVRDKESFLAAVRDSGLVGLGGAGFPTAVKLQPKEGTKIDTLIINAAECEPYITADDREMLECGNFVLSGIMATLKYLDIPKAVIAIERNKPEAMDLMFSLTKGESSLSVVPLSTRYPQGAEKVMIETVTRREVPEGGLPSDVGVIMMNVTTVSTLGKYLATGMPLVTKRVTVDGSAINTPKNVEAVIGTPLQEIIDFCGGCKEDLGKIICGGPMMGVAMADLSFPLMKQNNAILAFNQKEATLPEPGPCIRCGNCVRACPVGLMPIDITDAYEMRDTSALHKLSCDICISCGCCSYVCPAKRLVSQNTTLARSYYLKELAERGAKNGK